MILCGIDFDFREQLFNLCEFSDSSPTRWNLLYRASSDGFRASNFHSKCDYQTKTLTVIKTRNGNIFGGYTAAAWDRVSSNKADKNAFIFSLVNKLNRPVKMKIARDKEEHAIYCSSQCGPAFGYASSDTNVCDIFIVDRSNNSAYNFSNLGNTYEFDEEGGPRLATGSKEAQSFLAGAPRFTVDEIEVFQRSLPHLV